MNDVSQLRCHIYSLSKGYKKLSVLLQGNIFMAPTCACNNYTTISSRLGAATDQHFITLPIHAVKYGGTIDNSYLPKFRPAKFKRYTVYPKP